MIMVCAAIILAVSSGAIVYIVTSQYTVLYYRSTFEAMTFQIHSSLDIGLKNNYLVSQSLSDIMGIHCPNTTYWPNCRYLVMKR